MAIRKSELTEASALAQQVLTALLATVTGPGGLPGAQLYYACGVVSAALPGAVADGRLWPALAVCFDRARTAGATYVGMESVRVLAASFTPRSASAIAVTNLSIRMALIEQSQILAATDFVSRQDVDSMLDSVEANFGAAEETAADNHDNVSYRALIGLHAAVVNDLTTRARPLPRMVTYTTARRRPALWLAYKLYQDGSRAGELVDENKVVHPLFMPTSGEALSS